MIGQNCQWIKFFDEPGEEAFGPDGLDLSTLQQSQGIPTSDIPQYLIDAVAQDNETDHPTILMTDYFRRPSGEVIVVAQRFTDDAQFLLNVAAYRLECWTSPGEELPDTPPVEPEEKIATVKINKDMLAVLTGVIAAGVGYWLYVR
jgi:hypothetical protein